MAAKKTAAKKSAKVSDRSVRKAAAKAPPKRMGRPLRTGADGEPATLRVVLRLTGAEHASLERAALAAKEPLASWIRSVALAAAEKP